MRLCYGFSGGALRSGSPLIHSRSGFNLAVQWHLCLPHVQGRTHCGIVFSCGLLSNVHAFMSV